MISAAYVYDPSNVDAQVLFPYTSFSYVWSSTYNFGWFGVETKGYSTPTQYNRYVFDVIDHGFAATDYYDKAAQVYSTGALVVSGISPGPNGGLEGRTIVFTGDGGDLNTLTHEFGHAFGFHHICGNWEYRSFDSGAACTMHYNWYLMLNQQIERRPALYVYPDTDSPRFCTDHIKAIRTQNLEGVAKLGWSD
jgi:hypothetical protein